MYVYVYVYVYMFVEDHFARRTVTYMYDICVINCGVIASLMLVVLSLYARDLHA